MFIYYEIDLGGLSKECQNDLKLLLNVIIDKKTIDFRRFHLCVFLNVSSNIKTLGH